IHCEVIPNGYDEADFLNLSELQESNYFKLSFIGNLKTNQNPENLWKALAEVIKEEPSFSTDLRLNFTGSINPDVEKDLGRYNLLPNTTIEKYVPHDKALKKMQSTTILLYIIPDAPDNKGVLTGKLFEYLAAKRPFLSIGPPDGDAATILDETNAGAMFSPEDYLGIKNQIKHLYNLWKSGQVFKLYPDPEKVKKYERKRLTRKLANVLDTLTV
ncbi:MAG: glycosyl transferase family 1, partial [Aliifodinibius sp.]|nr:glycosyltransferase family 4 protein [Nitrosopumilaceae archaeon]NIV16650.1 glycosyl transferase family 1 [Fodinibius sp.]NIX63250.1 glycosyl transferase family 1 [Nitrosopumilaceae archaeon]